MRMTDEMVVLLWLIGSAVMAALSWLHIERQNEYYGKAKWAVYDHVIYWAMLPISWMGIVSLLVAQAILDAYRD